MPYTDITHANDSELRAEINKLKLMIELRDNTITQLQRELNEDESRKRLTMLINLRESKIFELQDEIKKITNTYKDQADFEARKKQFERDRVNFDERRIHAYYYETIIDILKDNIFLQGEWVKFMTFVKMACDPEEVKRLGG